MSVGASGLPRSVARRALARVTPPSSGFHRESQVVVARVPFDAHYGAELVGARTARVHAPFPVLTWPAPPARGRSGHQQPPSILR